MTKQEEADVLHWLENNPEMKEAAKADYDKALLTETRKIVNKNLHLGVMIFDNLIGGPNAQRHNRTYINLEAYSKHRWVPWGQMKSFIEDEEIWGLCSNADFWDIIVGTRHKDLKFDSFMI
eukprot:570870-Heterocapsa_arctica.AAC.1